MKRRSGEGGKATKVGRRKMATRNRRRSSPKIVPGRRSVGTVAARLSRERDEAIEREKATAEVLRVISSSPGELELVFQAMLENATRICEATFGTLYLREADGFRAVATHNAPTAYVEDRKRNLVRPPPDSALGQVFKTHRVTQVPDITATKSYIEGDPYLVTAVQLAGFRTIAAVPMLKDNSLIGAITINRQEVRPFTDKQIELVKNFAAQAVIAIENTRLLNELRQRTDDLSEALEQQTTTADILTVISNSLDDTQPVFEAIVQSGLKLFADATIQVSLADGDKIRLAAVADRDPARANAMRRIFPIPLTREYMNGVAILDGRVVDVPDAENAPPELAIGARNFLATGNRAVTVMPMMRGQMPIGALQVVRLIPGPLSDKQREVLRTFANQAVIAIENTRLLNELRQRTDDLTESLEQQTATSEVLKVISTSAGSLEPVFNAILENATRICEAKFGTLYLCENDGFRAMATYNAPVAYAKARAAVVHPHPDSGIWRAAKTRQVVQIEDVTKLPGYMQGDEFLVTAVAHGGYRTVIDVPMVKEAELIGVITIFRQEVCPFTDKHVALLQNFASQAVIAIDNARLLNELRKRTDDLSKSLEDLRTAQDRLVQTQKLASLGQLTAGIAHEIKNPLNFVNNFSGLSVELIEELQDTLKDIPLGEKARVEIAELTDTLRSNLDKIAQHGKRADSIVKNMLLHSREGSGERRAVDINALVDESLNLAYHGARAERQGFTITLERSFDPEAGEADVFPQEITRVLLNLISNGFYAATNRQGQADSNGYEPILTASTRSLGDKVEIRIRDNGTGIPPEVKDKMFNPFFTTKPAGEGTGLGLSISHDIIVKQHSGSIEVDTEPGVFTEFRIILPRTAA